jgi:Cu(I)/Ag(I) efflux system membrane fusion protein
MNTNIKTIFKIGIPTLLFGLFIGWWIFGRNDHSETANSMDETAVVDNTIWTCSMHPQIRQNAPGQCPLCGMDLIPLEEDSGEGDPMAINMSASAMQLADIRTAMVGKMNPVKSILLNGKVQADERLIVSQSSHIPGRIEQIKINFTGEYVSKGQEIASIYSPELVTAQEELFEAQKIKDSQPQLFSAAKNKLKNWKLTDPQIEQILSSGKSKEIFPMHADVSGYVTKKLLNLGDYVRKGEMIYEITNLSTVWILFDVYESDMTWVKKGNKVEFTVASLPGETFNGIITYIDPIIDAKTRVSKARIVWNNKSLKFKPEMFVTGKVESRLPMKTNAIVVPKSAVMWTGKRSIAYVKKETEKGLSFSMRQITLGASLGDTYVIESGLKEGEEIAVNGTFSIDAAAQLAGKPSMMSPDGGPAMTGHNRGGSNNATPSTSDQKLKNNEMKVSTEAKKALEPIIKDYLAFKNALTNDNLKDAQDQAARMQKSMSAVNMSLFAGESHKLWMSFSTTIQNALQHKAHMKTIEELRKAFKSVSDGVIGIVSSFKPMQELLYVDFCPMANDNKGADWLSESKDIRNPYFGSKMMTCGKIVNEIR